MSANIWAELDRLPVHHRIAVAAEIIKRDRPSLRQLARAAGLCEEAFTARAKRQESKE